MINPAWPEIAKAAPANLHHQMGHDPDDGGFAVDEVTILLLALLDQVRAVTGHRAWR